MGDPKKQRKKFSTPRKAWEKERIDEEKALNREYHFKNKQEIWKINSQLRNFARQAKRLITLHTDQAQKEKIQLLTRLKSLGLLPESGELDDVLGITMKDLLERRLQSIVFRKGLAKTMKQARQFIVHEHVMVNNKKLTSPNYLVSISEEGTIVFSNSSALIDEMHPERKQEEKLTKKPEAKAKAEAKEEVKPEVKKAVKKEAKAEAKEEKKAK